jgi:hypothetical protein
MVFSKPKLLPGGDDGVAGWEAGAGVVLAVALGGGAAAGGLPATGADTPLIIIVPLNFACAFGFSSKEQDTHFSA